jgi:histone deacetylase 1/2
VLAAAAERFCPHVIVCCAGAGLIAGDRLGCLNVSLDGHSRVLKALMSLELPLLVLGGCGFTQLNAAKVWCHATATLCGVELPMALPEHSYMDYYLHEPTLSVPTCTLDNRNSALALEALQRLGGELIRTEFNPETRELLTPGKSVDRHVAIFKRKDAGGNGAGKKSMRRTS